MNDPRPRPPASPTSNDCRGGTSRGEDAMSSMLYLTCCAGTTTTGGGGGGSSSSFCALPSYASSSNIDYREVGTDKMMSNRGIAHDNASTAMTRSYRELSTAGMNIITCVRRAEEQEQDIGGRGLGGGRGGPPQQMTTTPKIGNRMGRHRSFVTSDPTAPRPASSDGRLAKIRQQHHRATGGGANNMPFASSPLVYRGENSIFEDQCSVMSLYDAETVASCATSTPLDAPASTPRTTRLRGGREYRTPPAYHRGGVVASGSSSSHSSIGGGGIIDDMSPPPPILPPDSPMMELSMAKRCANLAQMSNGNLRKHNREALRNYRGSGGSSPASPKKARDDHSSAAGSSIGSASVISAIQRTPRRITTTPAIVAGGATRNTPPRYPPSISGGARGDAAATMTPIINTHAMYEDASPPPLWTDSPPSSASSSSMPEINPELIHTYMYPRLYLRDPACAIDGISFGNDDQGRESWWFRLTRKMYTTLDHVQDGHWRELLRRSELSRNDVVVGVESVHRSDSSFNTSSSCSVGEGAGGEQQRPLCSTLEDGSRAMSELCLGGRQQQQQHRTSGRRSRRGGGGGDDHAITAASTGGGQEKRPCIFRPDSCPQNSWSEPAASTIYVRGANYLTDEIKVPSEASIFTVLGVDNFVSGGKSSEENESWAATSYLRRWNAACEEVGIPRPPFLLIMNFVVPWGNFQVYFTRPDADDGPFSSRRANHPSERLWREFMEGTTEYRNKCFKLIPRICAGPWMIKKMVGSTPTVIGNKLPTSYRGSIDENYLEIILDVKGGSTFGSSVANSVVGKADAVTVDLGFVIEGQVDGHLPEQMLGVVRLHRLNMQMAPTHSQWKETLAR